MKPNFALSLSFKGITLLHRVADGWRTVGDVSLEAEDIAAELSVLRSTASALEPGGVRTKLLIPNEQIKYITIETPDLSDAARLTEARRALDGATPYEVDDLAFDVSSEGAKTHIAAVAHETLAEAEAFANEHRFHPVSFVAVPEPQHFKGEPFFGPTDAAAKLLEQGDAIDPDDEAVVVLGDITPVARPAPASTQAEPESEPEAVKAELEDAKPGTLVPAKSDSTTSEKTREAPSKTDETDNLPVVAQTPLPPAAIPKAPPASAPASSASSAPKDQDPTAEIKEAKPVSAKVAPAPAATTFASRRATSAPSVGTAQREKKATVPLVPSVAPVAAHPAAVPQPDSRSLTAPAPAAAPKSKSKLAFLSRRKPRVAPAAPSARPSAAPRLAAASGSGGVAVPKATSEAEQMTIFGARASAEIGGKPRFLGLLLTAALLLFLAGVAAWASVFLDDGLSLSRLFGTRDTTTVASAPQPAPEDPVVQPEAVASPPVSEPVTASLDPSLIDDDGAEVNREPEPEPEPEQPRAWTQDELEAKYATSGIWAMAPDTPSEPAMASLDDLYMTSIDPVSTTTDAVALPQADSFGVDRFDFTPLSPAPAGTSFTLNDNGLVLPSADGAMNPDGILVFAGRPAAVPPLELTRPEIQPEGETDGSAPVVPALAPSPLLDLRPRLRPGGLIENNERSELGGVTRVELAAFRPSLRPQSAQAAASAPEPEVTAAAAAAGASLSGLAPVDAIEPALNNATANAVEASMRPDPRPNNFARIVKRAETAAPQPTRVASTAAVAPAAVAPSLPSKTSVAQQATVKNAIKLRAINLIGVYGKQSSRRALIRLSNGRYQKVAVGDRLDGGQVSAIGDNQLRYRKRGRDVVLSMPQG